MSRSGRSSQRGAGLNGDLKGPARFNGGKSAQMLRVNRAYKRKQVMFGERNHFVWSEKLETKALR